MTDPVWRYLRAIIQGVAYGNLAYDVSMWLLWLIEHR